MEMTQASLSFLGNFGFAQIPATHRAGACARVQSGNTETLKLWERKAYVMREGHFIWPTPKSKQTMTGERAMSPIIKFVAPAELSIPAHPLRPKALTVKTGKPHAFSFSRTIRNVLKANLAFGNLPPGLPSPGF